MTPVTPIRTEELIAALAADAAPVSLLPPVKVRLARWTMLALSVTTALSVLIGVRSDVGVAVLDRAFEVEALLMLATALSAGATAFVLSVPGAESTPALRALPLLTAGAWIVQLAWLLARGGETWSTVRLEPWHVACGARIALLAVAPAVASLMIVRRAAPLEYTWTSGLSVLGAVAFAALGVQFVCPIDRASHLFVSHALPVAALALLGAAVGTRVLERDRSSGARAFSG